ncbi:hypothetical protein MAPG_08200 [Magnaporthiopsis poae ATCC 64411]|uniref:Single-strand DNA deaminase toxin A-like C-terminal domain-containing protein n=1 Tax=Magnaporthiopsis poae (strain ATCC 64411 / 73-15) TaxID=644358 RepID=A0A0C4E6Q4_MAGP6|nr:hypothetical protein MAPG_08200 [Magnaporthiopsis poae ATCC 64411]
MAEPSAPIDEAWRAQRRRELGLHDIHIAILDKRHDEARQLLLNDRSLTGARASDGTTPLMLAVLFGLKRAIRHLLRFGADRDLKDSQRRTAAEHCRLDKYTDRKRRLYSEVSERLSAANTCSRTERRWILAAITYRNRHVHLPQPVIEISKKREVRLLVQVGQGKQGQVLRSSPRRYGLPENLGNVTHVSQRGRVRNFKVTAEFIEPAGVNFSAPLTIGLLAAGGHLQLLKMAASGWSPNDGEDNRVLNAAIWTEMVKAFSIASGFDLHRNPRDNPKGREKDPHKLEQLEGRWCSSHVEKKLACYHLVQVMRKHLGDGSELNSGLFSMDRLRALRGANIPQEDREATILLGNVPCSNCDRFIKTVNCLAGLQIGVQPVTFFSDCDTRPMKAYKDEADYRRDTERQAETDDERLPVADESTECEVTIHSLPYRIAVGKMGPGPNSSIGKPATPLSFEEHQQLERYAIQSLTSRGSLRVAQDRSASRRLSPALPRPSTENPDPLRDSDSDLASQSESGSLAEGESELEPRTTPASNRVTLAATTHSRNAGLQVWSRARARWQAEAPPPGRGVSNIGRANSGREIRGSRRPGGQRGAGRRRRTAVGRGLADNTNGVTGLSRADRPSLEQFRYGGANTM